MPEEQSAAPAEPPEEPAGEPPEERRYPSTVGGAIYLGVLAVAGAAIGVAWAGDWRLGVRLLGGSLGAAALLLLVLPARDAGMLAVRHRLVDSLLLAGTAAALFFLAATIPDQPG